MFEPSHRQTALPRAGAWPLALVAATICATLATVCMMPFVGVATLAAATMPRRRALLTMLGLWAANQVIGFGLMGFPLDAHAMGWGAALGGASLAAVFVATHVLGAGHSPAFTGAIIPRLVLAFALAFAAYEGLLFGLAVVAGGLDTFTPAIVLRLLANELAWLVILAALYTVLTRAAPRVFGPATRMHFA